MNRIAIPSTNWAAVFPTIKLQYAMTKPNGAGRKRGRRSLAGFGGGGSFFVADALFLQGRHSETEVSLRSNPVRI